MSIEKAVRLSPENPGVLFRLAFVEQKAGKGNLALQHAARAVEVAPGRPDVLDALAQIQAANHRCSEALETEQRAIEAFPDSATAGAPAALRTRLREITNHCNQAPAQSNVSQRVLLRPVLKACSGKAPRPESPRDSLVARLTIREDGTVSAVAVSGEASKTLMATFKRYVESCTFEPVVVDGKPTPLETTLEMSTRPH
jgi:tetratricopeptide (TPR) repeat protein